MSALDAVYSVAALGPLAKPLEATELSLRLESGTNQWMLEIWERWDREKLEVFCGSNLTSMNGRMYVSIYLELPDIGFFMMFFIANPKKTDCRGCRGSKSTGEVFAVREIGLQYLAIKHAFTIHSNHPLDIVRNPWL